MITEISTFGSCSSRNIFNSKINNNYKEHFHINESVETVTFISLMSEPLKFDETLLDSTNHYDNECVFQDLSKSFLNFLKRNKIEYLMIDTYFDAVNEIIINDKKSFITDSNCLKRTSIYHLFNDKKRISISRNYDEYLVLWKKSIKLFFNFMSVNCPNIKIILNCARSTYKYCEKGKIIQNKNLKKLSYINSYRDVLDEYILENFDVEVLSFDENTLAYKEHIFGLHTTHYEPKYYYSKIEQLKDIVERNQHFDYQYKYNLELRNLQRQNLILRFNQEKNVEKNFPKLFKKYLTARIDLKNDKSHNSIQIIENNDNNSIVNYPEWFRDELGSGIVIHSEQRHINFKIKCINDGKLTLKLRAIDMNHNGQRLPIYIKYINFYINEEKINDDEIFVCHDQPYIYKQEVKDQEILTINIDWLPI